MILADLVHWQPAPGRVWEVRATAGTRAAVETSTADPDAVPSVLQADHLGAYAALRAAGGRHMAWTGQTSLVEGRFDPQRWLQAFGELLADHEGQRTWFDLEPGAAPRRHLLPAEAVTRPDAFELVAVDLGPAAGSDFAATLRDHLQAELPQRCTPDQWPAFGLFVVERDDDFDFLWACDHAFTDAASQLMLGVELPARYAALIEGVAPDPAFVPPAAERGSFLEYAAAERARAVTFGPDSPEVGRWRELLAARGGVLPGFPLDLGLAEGETAPVRIVEHDLVAGEDLVALERAAKGHGARVPSAIVAACAVAEARLTGRGQYLGFTVLGTRDQGPYARAQGWFCNFAPLAIDLTGQERMASVLPLAEQAFAEARALNRMPVHAALGVLLAEGVLSPTALGSPQLLSYIDLRWFPGAVGEGAGATAYRHGHHFTGAGRTRNASSWFNRDADRLYVAVQAPDTPAALASTQLFYGEVRTILRTLAAEGDLPLGLESPVAPGIG